LVRDALQLLKGRLALLLTGRSFGEQASLADRQPLALCDNLLALLRDSLALGRDALAFHCQLGHLVALRRPLVDSVLWFSGAGHRFPSPRDWRWTTLVPTQS
jgi:hypothetical protein